MTYLFTFMLGAMVMTALIEFRDKNTVHASTVAQISLMIIGIALMNYPLA